MKRGSTTIGLKNEAAEKREPKPAKQMRNKKKMALDKFCWMGYINARGVSRRRRQSKKRTRKKKREWNSARKRSKKINTTQTQAYTHRSLFMVFQLTLINCFSRGLESF